MHTNQARHRQHGTKQVEVYHQGVHREDISHIPVGHRVQPVIDIHVIEFRHIVAGLNYCLG